MSIYIKVILLITLIISYPSFGNKPKTDKIKELEPSSIKPSAVYTYKGNSKDDEEEESDSSYELEQSCKSMNKGTPKIIKKTQLKNDPNYVIEYTCIPKN